MSNSWSRSSTSSSVSLRLPPREMNPTTFFIFVPTAVTGVFVVIKVPKKPNNISSNMAMKPFVKPAKGVATIQPNHPAPDCMAATPSPGVGVPINKCHKPATLIKIAVTPINILGTSPFLAGFLNVCHAA